MHTLGACTVCWGCIPGIVRDIIHGSGHSTLLTRIMFQDLYFCESLVGPLMVVEELYVGQFMCCGRGQSCV